MGLKGLTASTSILFARTLTGPRPAAGEDVSAGKQESEGSDEQLDSSVPG